MAEVSTLERRSVLMMVGLTIVTLGVYPLFWNLKRREMFQSIAAKPGDVPSSSFLGAIFLASIVEKALRFVPSQPPGSANPVYAVLALALVVSAVTVLIGWFVTAFSYLRILKAHAPGGSFSGVATFFFGPYYLQYKVNRLPAAVDAAPASAAQKWAVALLAIGVLALPLAAVMYFKFQALSEKAEAPAPVGSSAARQGKIALLNKQALMKMREKILDLRVPFKAPSGLDDVLKAVRLREMPMVKPADHPASNGMTFYGAEVCSPDGEIDGSKLQDTGGWAVVSSTASECGGTLFIDCTHTDEKGRPWFEF